MARTKQTARKATGGRVNMNVGLIPPHVRAMRGEANDVDFPVTSTESRANK